MVKMAFVERRKKSVRNDVSRRMVKDIISARQEHKIGTVGPTAYADATTVGVVLPITQQITQGDDVNNRVGDVIRAEKLRVLFGQHVASTAFVYFTTRIIVFADTMNLGTVPGVTEILNSADPLSGFAVTNLQKRRFKVYLDKFITSVAGASNQDVLRDYNLAINKQVMYNAGSSVAAANGRGALFMLIISDSSVAGNTRYSSTWELIYTDS
jgi:hypothetical protein